MKFITFGCWNQNFCNIKDGTNGLSLTMNKLKRYVEESKDAEEVDFVVVLGDNYYPTNDKVISDNFDSGFQCLTDAIGKTKKYVILGNHDYDKDPNGVCMSLNKQQELFSKDVSADFFKDVIVVKQQNTLIIMIETTVYQLAFYEEQKKLLTQFEGSCYQQQYKFAKNYQQIVDHQNEQVKQAIKENPQLENLIILGHHPIISYINSKSPSKPPKTFAVEKLIDLYKNLEPLIQNKNIYHICADTHLHQEGIVKINSLKINQFIVGTGGAESDICPSTTPTHSYNVIYEMLSCKQTFGFLVVEIKDGQIQVEFKSSNQDGGNVNYYKKYLKYKTKYLNYKKMFNF